MKSFHAAIALSLSAALAGFPAHAAGTAGGQTAPAGTVPGQAAPDRSGENQSALSQFDETFLENATQGSYAEIEGSRLALEKTESAEVKKFAEMMIQDHGMMLKDASKLAAKKDYQAPTGPSVMQTAEVTALRALSGGAFDAMYVNRIGVAAHESAVEQFEEASRKAEDPDVKALATEALPKLREHLEMARALNEKQEKQ